MNILKHKEERVLDYMQASLVSVFPTRSHHPHNWKGREAGEKRKNQGIVLRKLQKFEQWHSVDVCRCNKYQEKGHVNGVVGISPVHLLVPPCTRVLIQPLSFKVSDRSCKTLRSGLIV